MTVAVSIALAATSATAATAARRAAGTVRVSVSSAGRQGNDISGRFAPPAVARGGVRVAFDSEAKNLVPDDTNGASDVFVRDRKTGTTTRVSVSGSGGQARGDSFQPAISAAGTVVAFTSTAPNLVAGDDNFRSDVFVHDLRTASTTLVSAAADGSPADGASFGASISSNGQMVAFTSQATNLIPGGTAGGTQVYVRNLRTGKTTLVGVNDAGEAADLGASSAAISADGKFVAFESTSSNLVPGGTNGVDEAYLRSLAAGTTTLVSVADDGTQGNGASELPSVDQHGTAVAFASDATNLVGGDLNGRTDIFVRDLATGTTERDSVSSFGGEANGDSLSTITGGSLSGPVISGSGRFVAFNSLAGNLVGDDTNTCSPFGPSCPDVFVHDRTTGITTRVSVSSDGAQGDLVSGNPGIDVAGTTVGFFSAASNLVAGDTNVCAPFSGKGHCGDILIHPTS
jgi:Tol biopolymer transport system component